MRTRLLENFPSFEVSNPTSATHALDYVACLRGGRVQLGVLELRLKDNDAKRKVEAENNKKIPGISKNKMVVWKRFLWEVPLFFRSDSLTRAAYFLMFLYCYFSKFYSSILKYSYCEASSRFIFYYYFYSQMMSAYIYFHWTFQVVLSWVFLEIVVTCCSTLLIFIYLD